MGLMEHCPSGIYLADSVGHGWTQQHVGEALCGVGWSASQPEDLRENRRGENKTHTLKTEQKSSLRDPEPQATYGPV